MNRRLIKQHPFQIASHRYALGHRPPQINARTEVWSAFVERVPLTQENQKCVILSEAKDLR